MHLSDGTVPDVPGGAAFDPFDLRPLASLNRRRIGALPGIAAEWIGQTGWELCSKQALVRLIHSPEFGLEPPSVPDLPGWLNELLSAPDGPACQAAKAVATRYGRRLGYLIASLILSPEGLTSPLSAWEAAYKEYWRAAVQNIVLGGGLTNGRLGQVVASAAEGILADCGLADRHLLPAANPSYLPLIGAARSLPAGQSQVAALIDFGQSLVKRGLAYFDHYGYLANLQIIPPFSVEHLSDPGRTRDLADAIIASLVETIRQTGSQPELIPLVTASVAAYIRDGRPDSGPGRDQGVYALTQISADITTWFAARIQEACGLQLQFRFAHDGASAARALAGQPHAAVIMLGTSLGVGFVPPAASFRPVAIDFRLEES
jgi:hypothetical protein